jgi:hypothetical protein
MDYQVSFGPNHVSREQVLAKARQICADLEHALKQLREVRPPRHEPSH